MGSIDGKKFVELLAASAPSAGHCNVMGTALSMNCLAEAMGMALPGTAAIPAPYRERGQDCPCGGPPHRGDGARGFAAIADHHAGSIAECDPREYRAGWQHQLPSASAGRRASRRRGFADQGLGDGRLRTAAAGESAACGRQSRRGFLSRGRAARRSCKSSCAMVSSTAAHSR
jgi:hypothetical protein